MARGTPLLFVPVGTNDARPFGMDARERACRLATNVGLDRADAPVSGRAVLLASMHYAWDPAWLKAMGELPGTILTLAGEPVMAHVPADGDPAEAAAGLEYQRVVDGYELVASEAAEAGHGALRKRERPFVMLLGRDPEPVERAAYDAAFDGVGDVLALYVWRRPGFHLTRSAARAQIPPGLVTLVCAILCALAFLLFWRGEYWWGLLPAFMATLLDSVASKLGRVTGAASALSDAFGNAVGLLSAPLWYWAWEHGLAPYGRPLEPVLATMVLWAIVGGYVAQHIVERAFSMLAKTEMRLWRPIDSKFRLVTAGRNTNMVILTGSLVFRRPDLGLEQVAWWTLASLIFHAVRLAQARERISRGEPVNSWLDA
jgi:hypothetical protein